MQMSSALINQNDKQIFIFSQTSRIVSIYIWGMEKSIFIFNLRKCQRDHGFEDVSWNNDQIEKIKIQLEVGYEIF